MTALRQKMIAAMRQRGFAQRTHNTYLMVVTDLARYFHRPPDTLSTDDLQHFFNHLVQERGLSAASCRVYLHGVRFLYLHVLLPKPQASHDARTVLRLWIACDRGLPPASQ